ncbi:MAG: hypothetical protein NZZ41_02360 [Candidatus Dojkabacteria bacterium]|nr:hypothetical protein [Candidatus Dojkabacteria bacterium]
MLGLKFKKGGSIFYKEKSQGLRGWFSRNRGTGWVDCISKGPCGGKKAGKKRLCRPTLSDCPSREKLNRLKRKKVMGKRISWK